MPKRTVDSIIEALKKLVEDKQPIGPHIWLEGAQDLNVLLGDEHDLLFELQQKVANIRLGFLNSQEGINVSEAKLRTEAMDEYKEYHKQKAKISRIEEFIRIAKIQSRMKDTEMGFNR